MKNQNIVFTRSVPKMSKAWLFRSVLALGLVALIMHASAATFNVTVGFNYGPWVFFWPSSVTIHPGDQVKWTWRSSGHSTTSGRPGMPSGMWDSGVRSQGSTFTHTFNSLGTFPYYCTPHWPEGPEVGKVIVAMPTPPPTGPP